MVLIDNFSLYEQTNKQTTTTKQNLTTKKQQTNNNNKQQQKRIRIQTYFYFLLMHNGIFSASLYFQEYKLFKLHV
jgi:hypothetical protein